MRWLGLAGVLAVLSTTTAHGAGFEKVVPWSGQYGGLANAATSITEGAQSLYFNPAGLVLENGTYVGADAGRHFEVNLNVSPTLSRFRGPTTSPTAVNGEFGFTPPFAGFFSWRPTDRLGLGAGVFVSAGTAAKFENVDFAAFNPSFDTLQPDLEAKLDVIEASLGAAYEILDGLRVGGAWRMSFVNAKFSSALPVPAPAGAPAGTPPVALAAVTLDSLTGSDFTGFRVGLQYAPRRGRFGLGLLWRTPVNFTAEGDVTAQLEGGVGPNGPTATLPASTGSVSAQLPSQIALGGWLAPFGRELRVVCEYTFTHYRVDRAIGVDATLTTPSGVLPVPDVVLAWDNQHVGRFGVEVLSFENMALRLGYAFVSQVTATTRARPTLASPGFGHSVSLGWGGWTPGGFRLDTAIEGTFANGSGTNEFGISGPFSSFGVSAHLGAGYSF